jgi:hypothetical protein
MNRAQLEHAIRAACAIAGVDHVGHRLDYTAETVLSTPK